MGLLVTLEVLVPSMLELWVASCTTRAKNGQPCANSDTA